MMNKIVYLFELDSVRIFDNPNKYAVLYTPGLKAAFAEIIRNGNSVAITMNQLTDSQFIREAIADDTAYHCLLRLFEAGALKVSLYGRMRTASQYIQQAVQKCLNRDNDSFVFSNLPVRSDETELLTEIRDALQFSDLALLSERIEAAEESEKLRLKIIYKFVNMILQLSVCETSSIPPKREPHRTFEDFLGIIIRELSACSYFGDPFDTHIKNAVEIITRRGTHLVDGRANRSNWLDVSAKESTDEHLANEIIHICYNYTLEDSIQNVAKHYDDSDFERTFRRDLINRIQRCCRTEKAEEQLRTVSRSQWHTAVRFAEYRAEFACANQNTPANTVYEADLKEEKCRWIFFMLYKNAAATAAALVYIIVFCMVNLGVSWLEDYFPVALDNLFISSVFSVALFGILGSLIDICLKFINHGDDLPDILESLINIVVHFCDFWRIFGGCNDSYRLP